MEELGVIGSWIGHKPRVDWGTGALFLLNMGTSKDWGSKSPGLAPIKLGLAVAIGIRDDGISKFIGFSAVGGANEMPRSENLFFIFESSAFIPFN